MHAEQQDEAVRSGALRITITPLECGSISTAVVGPFGYGAALGLAERLEALAGGAPAAVILDLRMAVLLIDPVRALNLCDRITGIPALAAPVAVVTTFCPPGFVAWFELECAKRGLTRRVFGDVRRAKQWATELALLTARA